MVFQFYISQERTKVIEKLRLHKVELLLVCVVFLVAFIPLIDLDSFVLRAHDNLDSYYVYYEILSENKLLYELDPMIPVDQVMNGLPRFCFPSPFNITANLFHWFGDKWGYLINHFLVRLIGFLGMYKLLSELVFKKENSLAVTIIALGFAFLPVFSVFGLSLLGQPILFFCFYKIYKKQGNYRHWLVIGLLPFWSYFVFSGLFIFLFLALIFLILWIRHKSFNFHFFIAIGLFVIVSVLVDYQLFYGMFLSGFESHREAIFEPTLNFFGVVGVALNTSLNGWYHSANFFGLPLLIVGLIGVLFSIRKKTFWSIGMLSMVSIILFSAIYSLQDWFAMKPFFEAFPIFVKFSLKRFHFLLPFLAFIFFASGVYAIIMQWKKIGKVIAIVVSAIVLLYNYQLNRNFNAGGYNTDMFKLTDPGVQGARTFESYFEPQLFNDIQDYIGKEPASYRIVSINISPSILQYNGFYTLDSFQNLYEKSYNEQFTSLNRGELDRFGEDKIGNRCYVRSYEAENDFAEVKELNIRYDVLRSMGAEYLVSRIPIETGDGELQFVSSFKSNISKLTVYLYNI